MTWGFFKKVVIADNLAVAVNHVYGNVEEMSGLTLLNATVFLAYQIYCDFSGYTDIAIGSARILGIDLIENFKRPYFSTSIREFWSRWHLSLSTWFRDYVYIPLGVSKKMSCENLCEHLIDILNQWVLAWRFMDVYYLGGVHGLYSLYERATEKYRVGAWKAIKLDGTRFQWFIQWSINMTVVLFSWVFFRADDLNTAITIVIPVLDSIVDLSIIIELVDSVMAPRQDLGIGLFRI